MRDGRGATRFILGLLSFLLLTTLVHQVPASASEDPHGVHKAAEHQHLEASAPASGEPVDDDGCHKDDSRGGYAHGAVLFACELPGTGSTAGGAVGPGALDALIVDRAPRVARRLALLMVMRV